MLFAAGGLLLAGVGVVVCPSTPGMAVAAVTMFVGHLVLTTALTLATIVWPLGPAFTRIAGNPAVNAADTDLVVAPVGAGAGVAGPSRGSRHRRLRRVAALGLYMIVRNGKRTVLLNNLGAYEVLEVSVAGPDLTLRFLDTYHRLAFDDEDEQYLDSYAYGACGGGLLVDCDARVLMVFTRYRSYAARTAYLDTVRRTWPGWHVRWAYDGIGDLVRHVGLEVAGVDDARRGPQPLYRGRRDDRAEIVYLVSVAGGDGRLAVYGPTWDANPPWWVGPDLLDALGAEDLGPTFVRTPRAGMHLDPATRTAAVWTINVPLDGLVEEWPRLWPGWRLEFWEDRVQRHLEQCGDAARVPVPDARVCGLVLAECFVCTWLFFLAEDVDENYRTLEADGDRVDRQRPELWKQTREQTAMARSELADVLHAITGEPYSDPRWPDTMDELRAELRAA